MKKVSYYLNLGSESLRVDSAGKLKFFLKFNL